MVHSQSSRITENITATDTWKPYSLSFSLFSPSHILTLNLFLHPLEKPKRVILLVSYTCVDVIIVNIEYFPHDSWARLQECSFQLTVCVLTQSHTQAGLNDTIIQKQCCYAGSSTKKKKGEKRTRDRDWCKVMRGDSKTSSVEWQV